MEANLTFGIYLYRKRKFGQFFMKNLQEMLHFSYTTEHTTFLISQPHLVDIVISPWHYSI